MGRYYFGTISGKFWFATQSSDDAAHFKNKISYTEPPRCLEYAECCCFVEDMKDNYCKKCYSSYEEHYEAIDDEELQENYICNSPLMYENNYIKYYFYDYELDFVTDKLNKIKNEITIDFDKIGFRLIKDDKESIEYELDNFDYINNIKNEEQEILIARWCLGKQIEQSIKEKGYCEIYCEI